jgi:hypothetical protein
MTAIAKSWWRNCLGANLDQADEEILAIDALEDSIAPIDDDTAHIRRLISCLESCHQKSERRIELIIEAIGSGRTSKGPGKRSRDQRTAIEEIWQDCCDILSAWCAGNADNVAEHAVAGISAQDLLGLLGERTPLKQWQVQRIVEGINADLDPSRQYFNMILDVGDYGEPGAKPIGGHYSGQEEFLETTVQTIIHDTEDGREAQIPLAMAIDLLNGCNWNFVRNLSIVLRAIGGDLFPETPFACCARNITLSPIRERMKVVTKTLGAFCEGSIAPTSDADADILAMLGEPTPTKHWLAASLSKTIRLQLRI